jgi:BMFP domain-containing protein YqiC
MTKPKRILSRLGKLGSEALISANSMKAEIEAITTEKMERLARRLQLVRRDEFEALQAMVQEMRRKQEAILNPDSNSTAPKKAAPKKASGKNKSAAGAPAAAPRRKR